MGLRLQRRAVGPAGPASWCRSRSGRGRCRSSTTASASSSASTARRSAATRRWPRSSPPTSTGSASCGRGRRCGFERVSMRAKRQAHRSASDQAAIAGMGRTRLQTPFSDASQKAVAGTLLLMRRSNHGHCSQLAQIALQRPNLLLQVRHQLALLLHHLGRRLLDEARRCSASPACPAGASASRRAASPAACTSAATSISPASDTYASKSACTCAGGLGRLGDVRAARRACRRRPAA